MTATEPAKIFTGTHGPDDGAGEGTPWPDDVPPDQDDTWYPLRDDPWRAKRMEYFIAFLWVVAALCGIGLTIVYCSGGQAELEGLFLLVGFGLLGHRPVVVGALPPPRPRHHGQPRDHHRLRARRSEPQWSSRCREGPTP